MTTDPRPEEVFDLDAYETAVAFMAEKYADLATEVATLRAENERLLREKDEAVQWITDNMAGECCYYADRCWDHASDVEPTLWCGPCAAVAFLAALGEVPDDH